MNSVFHLDNVSKTFGRQLFGKPVIALADIAMDIAPGEAVGFIGHNGAGKSTTIRIMLGLMRPSSGGALIRGQSACEPISRKGVAYVPEVALVYDHLTPRELLEMSMDFHGYRGQRRKQLGFWLERLGLASVADKRVRGFSKGMTQRTALAMALCVDPEALVLDEPLSGLDPLGRKDVVDVLDESRREGKTLFFSSHVLSDVERLADRFVFIHRGRIRATHSVSSILAAASDSYEVTFYTETQPEGFYSSGRGLWSSVLPADAIGACVQQMTAMGALLYGVKSAASLEQLYVRLVGTAESGSPEVGSLEKLS